MRSIRIFDKEFEKLVIGKNVVKATFQQQQTECFQEKENDLNKCSEEVPQLLNTATTSSTSFSTENDLYNRPKNVIINCSTCQTIFADVQQQREHYKLDWHRYNLKLALAQKPSINEIEFSQKTEQEDLSSISGSDTEDETDPDFDLIQTAHGRIYLQNIQGTIFSIYTCLLFGKKSTTHIDVTLNTEYIEAQLTPFTNPDRQITVLMLGGGHFAGAVFRGIVPLVHKTFHCYTVRAGQGGTQSSRDNKTGGGSHPKSAGASLRRYNEQALIQHVREILSIWKREIDSSHLILYRANGPHNYTTLFGGNFLDRNDFRLRTIPFSTRRATFSEVKRVLDFVSLVHIYDSVESAQKIINQQKPISTSKKPQNIKKSKEQKAPIATTHRPQTKEHLSKVIEPKSRHLPAEKKVPIKKTKKQSIPSKKIEPVINPESLIIIQLIRDGDLDTLRIKLLQLSNQDFNQILDDRGNTMLHFGAMESRLEIVDFLLENNADLCRKNHQHQTPYTITQNPEVRAFFKEYAKRNPEKYNYNKANIPVNSLTDEELTEKRRIQRKLKREKEKERKKDEEIRKKEQDEQMRFLQLSDREKMALAAERRILSQQQTSTVIARCFQCGTDISGKVPFEYSNNRFCSIDCLKKHRLTSKSLQLF